MSEVDLQTLSFLDPEVQECPYPAYERLRQAAPAFFDARAGCWVITRYDDIRAILLDPRRFSSGGTVELFRKAVDPERAAAAARLYEAEGWLPTPTLSLLDDPRHREVRAIFQQALRAGKVKALDPLIRTTAETLVDSFAPDGGCDAVAQFAVPLPLTVICSQVGVAAADIWTIKRWTDAWMRRFSVMQSPEEEADCIRQEIEFQRYFVDVVQSLQQRPDGSILSDLVNLRLSDGSGLSYGEIASHLLSDIFVGGSETTTNAIAEGVLLLCRNPDQYARLQADRDRHLPGFVEEVLRLETPVQGLFRVTTEPVELCGVSLPTGSLLNLRFASANRDAAHFACPAEMDIQRRNAGSHLAFGSGIHHCVGAPLARRELFWAFDALLRRTRGLALAPGLNDLAHGPGMMLRALKALHVIFEPVRHVDA